MIRATFGLTGQVRVITKSRQAKFVDRERAAVRSHEVKMRRIVRHFLADQAPDIAAQLARLLGLTGKAEDDSATDTPGVTPLEAAAVAHVATDALARLNFKDWRALYKLVSPTLESMSKSGGKAALDLLGVTDESIVTLMGDRTVLAARQRAAEMVGMRALPDGELIENPSARWRIDESTREMLRELVVNALTDGWSADTLADEITAAEAFSPERAEMIARTEIANADMQGTMTGYRTSGLVAGKRWLTSHDDKVSDECAESEDAGIITLDDVFPPNDVDAPPNHPNCRCTVLPVLTDEMEPEPS
jgi:SPP1 gp7 family putative phage head morphogenesis protein